MPTNQLHQTLVRHRFDLNDPALVYGERIPSPADVIVIQCSLGAVAPTQGSLPANGSGLDDSSDSLNETPEPTCEEQEKKIGWEKCTRETSCYRSHCDLQIPTLRTRRVFRGRRIIGTNEGPDPIAFQGRNGPSAPTGFRVMKPADPETGERLRPTPSSRNPSSLMHQP